MSVNTLPAQQFSSQSDAMSSRIDGITRCTRYACGPNRLQLCGPDMHHEVIAYLAAGASDGGLAQILRGFQTLYPYLENIAHANHIRDPFHTRIVEAYWIGNELLDAITPRAYFRHITDIRQLRRTPSNSHTFDTLAEKLRHGATMHHNFHVMNVWQRTGYVQEAHTLNSMDQCRVSWGTVTKIDGPYLTLKRQPLATAGGKLLLGPEETVKIIRRLNDASFVDDLRAGDVISLHWDVPCDIVDARELRNLKKYTALALSLANITVLS